MNSQLICPLFKWPFRLARENYQATFRNEKLTLSKATPFVWGAGVIVDAKRSWEEIAKFNFKVKPQIIHYTFVNKKNCKCHFNQ